MKISVIFTGGTIGSRLQNGFVAPNSAQGYQLLENYKNQYGGDVEFCTSSPYECLSETLNAKRLNSLIDHVRQCQSGDFDGIIITHGTDTLQYTAAALSLTVAPKMPIVLVSSNYPLCDERANGQDNFYAAVELIKTGIKGVFVSYRNGDGRLFYHKADKLLRHIEMSDELLSVGGPFGELVNGSVEISGEIENAVVIDCKACFTESPGILVLHARPEDAYCYNLDNVKAILIEPYHSGTLNTESGAFEFFCNEAMSRGIPIFVPDILQGDQYASSATFQSLGLISLLKTPSISAYIKLWLGVSMGADLRSFMQ